MDVNDFSKLSPTNQKDVYDKLVKKRDDHLNGIIFRCERDTLINYHLWMQLKKKLQEIYV